MQTVSAAFLAAAAAAQNNVTYNGGVSWDKAYNAAAKVFTIGVSTIGGPDFIGGTGGTVTYFDKYAYSDETANIDSITIDRSISTIPIGIMSAQLDIELNNTSRRYLPRFDPTIGNYIKAGRPIRIQVGFDNENLPQFVGYTSRPTLTLVSRTIHFHAFDAMEYLNNFTSALPIQTNIKAQDLIAALLVEAGFSSAQYQLDNSLQNPIAFIDPRGRKTGAIIDGLSQAELATSFFAEDGIFHFWNRYHFNTNPTAVATLSYSNITDIGYIDTPVRNWVRVTTTPRAVSPLQPVWIISSPIQIDGGSTYHQIGSIIDDSGALPVTSLDTPVYSSTPISGSYITANTNIDGSGIDSYGYISLSNFANLGTSYAIDIANTSSSTLYVTDLVIYGTPAKVIDTFISESKDDTSIDDNGINPDDNGDVVEITNDYIQSSLDAQAYADNMVRLYKNPRRQLYLPVFANPSYQFGDVFQISIDDTGESFRAVNLGGRLQMSPDQVIAQTLTVEERSFASYFRIGVSTIGGSDVIAP